MPAVPTVETLIETFEAAVADLVHAAGSDAQAREVTKTVRTRIRDFLHTAIASRHLPEAKTKRQVARSRVADQRWLAKNQPMIEDILTKLTAPPYQTLQALANEYGVSRERIRQIASRAAQIKGVELPSKRTRSAARRKPKVKPSRPACAICGKDMNRKATAYEDGNYYCASHRYRHAPGYKKRHAILVKTRLAERKAQDPVFAQHLRDYHRQWQRQRKLAAS